MARDVVHTTQVVDAVIAVLKGSYSSGTGVRTGGLPNTWFDVGADGTEVPLRVLDHGDLSDYPTETLALFSDALTADLPAILVRGMGPIPTGRGGTSGVIETHEVIRVVHVRRFDQCRTSTGTVETNMCRARERYAKTIGQALLYDEKGKLAVIAAAGTRTEVTLTSTDGAGAQLINVEWQGWDFEGGADGASDVGNIKLIGLPIWAIACDLRIRCQSGGAA